MSFPSPTLTPPTLEPYQFEYDGLVFGAATPIAFLQVEGLDLAAIRSGDIDWPRDHGQARGLDLYAGRDVLFDLWVKTDGTSLQATLEELAAVTEVRPEEEVPLWFQLPNMPLLCVMCRPRKRPVKIDSDYAAANVAKPELSLHATDPRIYSAGKATEIKPNHPATTVVLDNLGNTEMRPIVVFTGPLARPTITNETITGKPFLTFSINVALSAEERAEREQEERSKKAERESSEEGSRTSRLKEEAEEKLKHEKAELAEKEFHEETVVKAREKAENEEAEEKKEKEEAKEVFISPKEKREVEEQKAAREYEYAHRGKRPSREKEEEKTRHEAEKSEEKARAEAEGEEATAKVAAIKAEKEKQEVREADEKAGTFPTVKTGDQILVDLGTPHLAQYWTGGVGVGEPKNIMGWLDPASTWWDLLPGNNSIKFSSYDAGATAGVAEIEWASAYEL